ncbi:hypothetical protein OH77DRAFT_1520658 [Trametes cingulata]|nr:hypothetical protein OH77DRAFT_1520658 [Trametes cingulata]
MSHFKASDIPPSPSSNTFETTYLANRAQTLPERSTASQASTYTDKSPTRYSQTSSWDQRKGKQRETAQHDQFNEALASGASPLPQDVSVQAAPDGYGLTKQFPPPSYASISDAVISLFLTYPYGLGDVSRDLGLPEDVPSWDQAVRAGIVLTGLVEDLYHQCRGVRPPWTVSASAATFPKDDWIATWLKLQPIRRRSSIPVSELTNPRALTRPLHTSTCEWQPFWTQTRQLVFQVLYGLQDCSPLSPSKSFTTIPMTSEDWIMWVEDVAWAFHQMIHLVKADESGVVREVASTSHPGSERTSGFPHSSYQALNRAAPSASIPSAQAPETTMVDSPVPGPSSRKRSLEPSSHLPQSKRPKKDGQDYTTAVYTTAMEEFNGDSDDSMSQDGHNSSDSASSSDL